MATMRLDGAAWLTVTKPSPTGTSPRIVFDSWLHIVGHGQAGRLPWDVPIPESRTAPAPTDPRCDDAAQTCRKPRPAGRCYQPARPGLGRILQPGASSTGLQGRALVCATAASTMVGETQRTSRHRVPPIPGRVPLRDARPTRLAAPSRRPAEREGLMTRVKAGCGKSARPV